MYELIAKSIVTSAIHGEGSVKATGIQAVPTAWTVPLERSYSWS